MVEDKTLELWGGVECTINRVRDDYFDQCERSGHSTRLSDLECIAELGIKAIRYPVLWEKIAPNGLHAADWSWTDERLERLRALNIRPIAGLIHHGSGPRWTNLLDERFPEGLAEFAHAAARRYPWVNDWTPVNEPLTTARFSGLYGHWYPHGRDDHSFVQALLNQCRGVVLGMAAIRNINPAARLIQTDDLGKTWSTPSLQYQADFENARRWITFDLLCGKVDRGHPLWNYLRYSGASESQILWFAEHPCPPDVIGLNHYLSSERFLDEHIERYPKETHGGNGRQHYADILAARVRLEDHAGLGALLRETWERFGLPIAITEAHNGSSRDEQVRWLKEVWDTTQVQRNAGVDVRAVTVWSLLGVHGWDNLVTLPEGIYEPGAFDLRGPKPRPTAIAKLMRNLADGQEPSHAVYAVPGWWHRPERFIYGFALDSNGCVHPVPSADDVTARLVSAPHPVLIMGGSTLADGFVDACRLRGLAYRIVLRDADIADPTATAALLDALQPWVVIAAAPYVDIDGTEYDREGCYRGSTDGAAVLAQACSQRGIALLAFSSDQVFDGQHSAPYTESDAVAPVNAYGHSKADADHRILSIMPEALIVRSGPTFTFCQLRDALTLSLDTLAAGLPVVVDDDAVVSPTYVPHLVETCLDLLIDGEHGSWHLANQGALRWSQLVRSAAERVGLPNGLPIIVNNEVDQPAHRSPYRVLESERGMLLPPLEHALANYCARYVYMLEHTSMRIQRTAHVTGCFIQSSAPA